VTHRREGSEGSRIVKRTKRENKERTKREMKEKTKREREDKER
jgi:hypothetical protein